MERTLTVIEGRPENQRIIDDFRSVTQNRNWGFEHLNGLNSDRIARFDFRGLSLDCVVFRSLTRNNYTEAERLLEFLKRNDKIVINASATGARSATSDKHFQQGLFLLDPVLKDYALPTFEAKNKTNVLAYIRARRVHFPIVLKYRYGTTGENITLIRDEKDLDKVKDFSSLLIEQYIEPECDWRVFVVGGTAVGIMRKNGDPNHPEDFVAWSAGREKNTEDDRKVIDELSEIATRAAAISRLEYTGVDIIREAKTKKLYILETNFAAGWMNFIPVTKISIPDLVLDWFEERISTKTIAPSAAVETYLERRKRHLPTNLRASCDQILKGVPGATDSYIERFSHYPNRYLPDAGYLFSRLCVMYRMLTEQNTGAPKSSTQEPAYVASFLRIVESLPLSWAGNFIGPEVGTLHDGAILSALYLFLLHKTSKM